MWANEKIEIKLQMRADEAGVFAHRKPIARGHSVFAYEGMERFVQQRPLHRATQRIGPVEHHDGFARPSAILHRVRKRVQIGVKPGAHVLNVVNQNVKRVQHLLGHPSRRAIQAEDGNARFRVHFACHMAARLHRAANAVFAGEQRAQIVYFRQNVHRGPQPSIHTRGPCD